MQSMYIVVTREGVCREYISIPFSSSSAQPRERGRRVGGVEAL